MAKTRVGVRNGGLIVPSSNIITDGLVLHLDAGNTSSYPGTGTDWFDLTSNNNDGVLINGPTFDSGNGGSISFDGINDYVNLTSTVTNNIYTLDFWYKMGVNDGSYGYFASSGNNGFAISEGGTLGGLSYGQFYYYNGNINVLAFIPSTTNWNHIIVTIDTLTNNLKIYGNGVEIINTTINNMSNSVSHMGHYLQSYNFLRGNLGSYRIYNRTLSLPEIQQNYNATKGRFGL